MVKLSLIAGGGVAATGAVAGFAARAVLRRQAARARSVMGQPLGHRAPDSDRNYRPKRGHQVELLVVGDSIAAGLGADDARGTLGARLARKLSKRTDRAVRLRTIAQVGAESSMLAEQLDDLPVDYRPDIAVVIVGGNDVTHRVPIETSIAHLQDCIERLQELDAAVVVGTCPNLGALRAVPQPLRSLGAWASRQLAQAQRTMALSQGAYVVSLAEVAGPFFITNPEEMFSLDRFHPSALGYKRTATAMLPSLLAALGERDDVPFGHHLPESVPG